MLKLYSKHNIFSPWGLHDIANMLYFVNIFSEEGSHLTGTVRVEKSTSLTSVMTESYATDSNIRVVVPSIHSGGI
jgi:hypothetical protein